MSTYLLDVSHTIQFRKIADHGHPLARRFLIAKSIEQVANRNTRRNNTFVSVHDPLDPRHLFTAQLSEHWAKGDLAGVPTLFCADEVPANIGFQLPMQWLVSGGQAAQQLPQFNQGTGYRVTIPRSNQNGR